MRIADHLFEPKNAAYPNACKHCSRVSGAHPTRDPQWEERFLTRALDYAQQMQGLAADPKAFEKYRDEVNARLALGAERYGDLAFMQRDNLIELGEETPDVSGYGMLELRKQQLLGLDDETYNEMEHLLAMAAAHGAIADGLVRKAFRARDRR